MHTISSTNTFTNHKLPAIKFSVLGTHQNKNNRTKANKSPRAHSHTNAKVNSKQNSQCGVNIFLNFKHFYFYITSIQCYAMIWFDVIWSDPIRSGVYWICWLQVQLTIVFTHFTFEGLVNRFFMDCRCCNSEVNIYVSFQFCWFPWWKRLIAFFSVNFSNQCLFVCGFIYLFCFVLICFCSVLFCHTHKKVFWFDGLIRSLYCCYSWR